jgi:hypothetical protein
MATVNEATAGGESPEAQEKGQGCCHLQKKTIAIALFGIGVVGAVIVWGFIR